MAKRSDPRQGVLFGPATVERSPAPVWDGPKPWDPIDAADAELGWAYRWVTPTRARELRAELGR